MRIDVGRCLAEVTEPTFVGGKMIKMLIFDIKNSKNVDSFCTYFSIIN